MNTPNSLRRLKAGLLQLVHGKHLDESRLIYELYADKATGVMIDVGTHFGSSLLPFAQKGWQVYGFEPDSNNRQKVISGTSGMKNVSISNLAVSDKAGLELEFFTSNVSTGISSLANFHYSHSPTAKVITTTLRDEINERAIPAADFLKIDTEGFDLFVLKGFDWEEHPHPTVIVCEFENKKTLPLGYSVQEMSDFLTDKGYRLLISEWYPIVEYGQRHRWKGFIGSPRQITEPNAWGNVIAVKSQLYTSLVKVCSRYGPVAW